MVRETATSRKGLDSFIKAVDNLVREWATDEPKAGAIPREQLRVIWEQVRDDTAFELASQMEGACKMLHKHYLNDKP